MIFHEGRAGFQPGPYSGSAERTVVQLGETRGMQA